MTLSPAEHRAVEDGIKSMLGDSAPLHFPEEQVSVRLTYVGGKLHAIATRDGTEVARWLVVLSPRT